MPGVSVTALFMTALLSCFVPGTGTVYGALKSHLTNVDVSHKNAMYNFLSSSRNNWRKLNLLLASKVIRVIRSWSDPDRKFCFVVDDSMLERPKGKMVELLSWQFDHVTRRCIRAFNCLQLGWTDGVSYIPVASALMTSRKARNRFFGIRGEINKRCCGYRRRKEAMRAKPHVVVSMLKQALSHGIDASYVLFDSWFTCEPLIEKILRLGLDVIGMLKDTRQTYFYQGRWLSLGELYKAIPHKNKDIKSDLICTAEVKTRNHGIECKIVFIRNRNNRSKYLAILSTDTSLDSKKIIAIYAERWLIETNFRAQKQYFKLGSETCAVKYDNLVAFATLSSIRYMLLEFKRRTNGDARSIGELAREQIEQMESIPYAVAIETLMQCFEELPQKLQDAGVLKDGCLAKVEQIINDTLCSWFHGITDYLQTLFSELMPDEPCRT